MPTDRVLLIDADICAYQAAALNQRTYDFGDGEEKSMSLDFDSAKRKLDEYLDNLLKKLKPVRVIFCLSCATEDGWRRQVLPTYKFNRNPADKPQMLLDLKDYIRENHETFERPTLEADDIMGILSTHPTIVEGTKVIVSIDKDMKTIPGYLYNDKDAKIVKISEAAADVTFFMQVLTGDVTDGYKGCPGIGAKKAEKILTSGLAHWPAIVAAYASKGLTEDDALQQARVARICRSSDYDYTTKKVKLWTPPAKISSPPKKIATPVSTTSKVKQ